jgi:predicted DNA-binding transcriptional regulator YafY
MSRSTRLLALLQALRGRRRPVTAAVLAGMLEVSEEPFIEMLPNLYLRGYARTAAQSCVGSVKNRGVS